MADAKRAKSEQEYKCFLEGLQVDLTDLERSFAVCYFISKYTKPVIMRKVPELPNYHRIIDLITSHEDERGEKVY